MKITNEYLDSLIKKQLLQEDSFADGDKKVHKVESEWHYPILKKYGFIPVDKTGIGFVRNYIYKHPKLDNKIKCSTGINAEHWMDLKTNDYGYWSSLETHLKKITSGKINEDTIKKTLSSDMKKYLYYDGSDPLTKEFGELYFLHKKDRDKGEWNKLVKVLSNKPGYVGSGKAEYEYKGHKFKMEAGANGRGFWGTDVHIFKINENIQEQISSKNNKDFYRVPKTVIGNQAYSLQGDAKGLYSWLSHGNDFDENMVNIMIAKLEKIKESAKLFKANTDLRKIPKEYRWVKEKKEKED